MLAMILLTTTQAAPARPEYYACSLYRSPEGLLVGDHSTDYWVCSNLVLRGPKQTGVEGRWEVVNHASGTLLYETTDWDGVAPRRFSRVYGASPPECVISRQRALATVFYPWEK